MISLCNQWVLTLAPNVELPLTIGPRKKVKVQYRKLADISSVMRTTTLHAALSKALKEGMNASKTKTLGEEIEARRKDFDVYGTLVLNYFHSDAMFFFGEIVRFEPGAPLSLLDTTTAGFYNLHQKTAGDHLEALRGVLYFMVINDHVMILESDCSAARTEDYFTWLLDQSSVLHGPVQIVLDAELEAENGHAELQSVGAVSFKPAAIVKPPALDITSNGHTERKDKYVGDDRALRVIKAAGMDETDIQEILRQDHKISVKVEVKFQSGRGGKPVAMSDARRLLRNIDEDALTLTGNAGRQRNGKIVKLTHPANILLVGSLYDRKDVQRALIEAYEVFKANGYIE